MAAMSDENNIRLRLTDPDLIDEFSDCQVGEEKTITIKFTATKKDSWIENVPGKGSDKMADMPMSMDGENVDTSAKTRTRMELAGDVSDISYSESDPEEAAEGADDNPEEEAAEYKKKK